MATRSSFFIGGHRVQANEVDAHAAGIGFRDRGFARSRRTEKNHRHRGFLFHRTAEEPFGTDQVFLAENIV